MSSTLIGSLKVAKADNLNSDSNGNPNAWPMFHGDLARTGYSASTAPLTNKTLWTQQAGTGIVSSPIVADGIVYISSEDGNLYALNSSDGSQVWVSQVNALYSFSLSSPAIANGVLYIGSDNGTVFALNSINRL